MARSADADRRGRPVRSAAMARRPRMALPDVGSYHLTCSGVARQEIYRDDKDRSVCSPSSCGSRLAAGGGALLAYCLMPQPLPSRRDGELERLSRGMHPLPSATRRVQQTSRRERPPLRRPLPLSRDRDRRALRRTRAPMSSTNAERAGLCDSDLAVAWRRVPQRPTLALRLTREPARAPVPTSRSATRRRRGRSGAGSPSACSACIILWICVVPS